MNIKLKKNVFRVAMVAVLIIIIIPVILLVSTSIWNKSIEHFDYKKDLNSYYDIFSGNVTYCDISLSRYENNVLTPYKTLRLNEVNIEEFADFFYAAKKFDNVSSVNYIKENSINVFINVIENNITSQINIYINLENEEIYLPESKSTLKIKKENIEHLKKILL